VKITRMHSSHDWSCPTSLKGIFGDFGKITAHTSQSGSQPLRERIGHQPDIYEKCDSGRVDERVSLPSTFDISTGGSPAISRGNGSNWPDEVAVEGNIAERPSAYPPEPSIAFLVLISHIGGKPIQGSHGQIVTSSSARPGAEPRL
jgi:hypothetical protein